MFYYIFGMTDKGDYREINEDCILVDHEVLSSGSTEASVSAPFITAVGDGVGGENSGELASKLCLSHLGAVDYSSTVDIKRTVINIHNKIKKQGIRAEGSANMQTTLCALAVDEKGRALCINVGDSRMYRYVNGTVRQISTDQSYGQYLYDHGRIDSMSETPPQFENAIISSVGSTLNDPDVDITPIVSGFGKEPDDMIIIASDGFSDTVTPEEIEIGMELDIPIAKKLSALFHLAVRNGSTDNISVIGIKPYIDNEELRILTQKKNVSNIVKLSGGEESVIEDAGSEKTLEKTAEILDTIEQKAAANSQQDKNIDPDDDAPTKIYDPSSGIEAAVAEETPVVEEVPAEDEASVEEVLPETPEQTEAPVEESTDQGVDAQPADAPVVNVFRPERKKKSATSELVKLTLSSLDDLSKI